MTNPTKVQGGGHGRCKGPEAGSNLGSSTEKGVLWIIGGRQITEAGHQEGVGPESASGEVGL